jgi:Putative peptidoglycan binding domain
MLAGTAMSGKHVVKTGESPAQIAASYGFEDWTTIYQHADNADLRQKRKDPGAIFPGDVVAIPTREPTVYTLATGKRHRIVVKRPKAKLNVVVKDHEGEPLAGKAFELRAPSLAAPIEGTTTADGHIESKVPLDLIQAQLVVWDSDDKNGMRYVWSLDLGGLFPPEAEGGARQRLNNLGYHAGQASDAVADGRDDDSDDGDGGDDSDDKAAALTDPLSLAIAAFQEDYELEVTGKIDDNTRAKLVEAHGGT